MARHAAACNGEPRSTARHQRRATAPPLPSCNRGATAGRARAAASSRHAAVPQHLRPAAGAPPPHARRPLASHSSAGAPRCPARQLCGSPICAHSPQQTAPPAVVAPPWS
eukprot:7386391-Prymnesium_polylepis.1